MFTTDAVVASEPRPNRAARRPGPPPVSASAAAEARRQPRVVGGAREPAHGVVERRCGRASYRRVHGEIQPLCILGPAQYEVIL